MVIKNKGYASYLVIVHGHSYKIINKEIHIDLDLASHDKLNLAYKNSVHNKIQKLNNKFLHISSSISK